MLHIKDIKKNSKVRDSQDGRVGVVCEIIEAYTRYNIKTDAPVVPKVIVDFGNYKIPNIGLFVIAKVYNKTYIGNFIIELED